jgi:hypothetical protein
MDGGDGRWAGSRGEALKKDATAEAVVAVETSRSLDDVWERLDASDMRHDRDNERGCGGERATGEQRTGQWLTDVERRVGGYLIKE